MGRSSGAALPPPRRSACLVPTQHFAAICDVRKNPVKNQSARLILAGSHTSTYIGTRLCAAPVRSARNALIKAKASRAAAATTSSVRTKRGFVSVALRLTQSRSFKDKKQKAHPARLYRRLTNLLVDFPSPLLRRMINSLFFLLFVCFFLEYFTKVLISCMRFPCFPFHKS